MLWALVILGINSKAKAVALAEESFLGEEKTLFRIDEVKVLGNRKVEIEAILEKINSRPVKGYSQQPGTW